ncbi:MAG: hypothetical protein CM1200mP30_06490 [Pseudomonadota bacterium]|nr:MAG: hypothetical protein CM1200mP30_06490 [Pseudomonadota bacterium]
MTKISKKILFVFEIFQGKPVWFDLHPGVKMEQNPKSWWPGIYIHELIFMFKWRSHSPGSIKNMSNKRASVLTRY